MAEAWIVLASLALEALVGYPAALHARIPHPVVWAGNAINALERLWNKAEYTFAARRALGCIAIVLVTVAAVIIGWGLQALVGFVVDARAGGIGSAVPGPLAVPAGGAGSAAIGASAAPAGGALAVSVGGALAAVASTLSRAATFAGGPWAVVVGSVAHTSGGDAVLAGVASGCRGPWAAHLAGVLVVAIVGTVGLAQRSLFDHVNSVLAALRAGDLAASRVRVSLIVGRDTQRLDATGVCAAALESLAESFNDGIVAPAFWFLVAGLPGLFAYKVLNTADSLIGHKEERWRAFGWAAARADDVANLVPARIAGALLVLAGRGGLGVMFSDASKHSSPNAGWPEAAMAGALRVQLGGPATYDGVLHERPIFGSGPAPGTAELGRGLRIYVIACSLLWLSIAGVGVVVTAAGSGALWLH